MKFRLIVSLSVLFIVVSFQSFSQTASVITTNDPTGSPFCGGVTVAVPYVANGTLNAGNTFTVQLSNASGSFAAPTTLITTGVSTVASGSINVTLPISTPTGTGYRIRVNSSNPAITGFSNVTNLTINAPSITAPVFTGTSFCNGSATNLTVSFDLPCAFTAGNTFTAQLSDATGSFTTPTNIGTITSNAAGLGRTINAVIPAGLATGTAYRIRVVASAPATNGPNNGTDLTISAPAGTPATFGTTAWNVYAYNGTNTTIPSNAYAGFYTETGLSFNTTTRWANTAGPAAADASSGSAFAGCSVGGTNYAMSFKRTNFTCGYYRIDIPGHDDNVVLLINGVNVYQHIGCCDAHTGVWTGFLGPTTQVEFQLINFGGPGFLQVTIGAATNPLTMSPPVTKCAAASTTLSVSTTSGPLTYSWSPATTPATGASVVATPATTTTYTVTGTDAASPSTGCTVNNTVTVTVVPNATVPTVNLTASPSTNVCSGVTTSTLTATGANTYTWSPTTGLTPTTGPIVVANPASNTTYTVTGSTGCQSATKSIAIAVQNVPASPTTSTFGSGTWNVFAYNSTTVGTNYYGYYTENNLNFNTTTRWAAGGANGPSVANNTSGLAYSGCIVDIPWAMSFKRTGIPCGYYQIDVPAHDDNLALLINGVQVYSVGYNTLNLTNVWSGFISPSMTVEFQLVNTGGPGNLQVNFTPSSPLTLSPPVTICANTSTNLTAVSSVAGVSYAWSVSPSSATITLGTPTAANTTFQTTGATPGGPYTVTCLVTDPVTTCTASSTVVVTVNPTPTTAVTPTAVTTSCPSAGITLTATGANTYSWTNSGSLSAATGYQVVATPTVTTTYTVTGNNNCSSNSASTTITVIPVATPSTFPTGTWNVYGFNSTTIGTSYQGYYTENGSGTSGYDFNTTTRWGNTLSPASATAGTGNAWLGCTMLNDNFSVSFKRTGFACGLYQVNVLNNDDGLTLIINGVTVATRTTGTTTKTLWTGALNANSQVEWQLVENTGGASLQVQFVPIAAVANQTVWMGGTSTDWFTASNWCGGLPSATVSAVIPAAGPQNMPIISNTGAAANSVNINGAIAATTFASPNGTTSALPAANLGATGSFDLAVNGDWLNSGTLTAGTVSVTFQGSSTGNTITSSATENFKNVTINKPNNITISSGNQQISGAFTLTSGIVFQNGGLEVLNGGTLSGGSNTSYVDGTMRKTGSNAFVFPLGTGGLYKPIGISAPASASDTYLAQYVNSSPNGIYPNAQRDGTLDHVSNAEYWLLNRISGSGSINVMLSWNTNSGGVGNTSKLRVAGWNGTTWKDQGNNTGALTGTTTTGTLTASVATSTFGPFTLGTSDNSNPLPVEFISFDCSLDDNDLVQLKWATATEIDNNYFVVERAAGDTYFKPVGQVKGSGNSKLRHDYKTSDPTAPAGVWYYRLKQVDYDAKFAYSTVCRVEKLKGYVPLTAYPNPADEFVYLEVDGSDVKTLSIVNSKGEEMKVTYKRDGERLVLDSSRLASGIYMVQVSTSEKQALFKVVVDRR
jgi:hypothetical protein